MPVPFTIKATLFFQVNSFGWTESFFWLTTSNNLVVQSAALNVIAQKRAVLLGSQAFIKAQRVSVEYDDLGAKRVGDSFLSYNRYNGSGTPGADDPDTAVLVTARNLVAQRRRNMFLRGIWDDVNGAGGFYLPTIAGWQTAYNSWMVAMLTQAAGWMASDRRGEFNLVTYTMSPTSGTVNVQLEGTPFLAPNDARQEVRFSGVNNKSALNGMKLVDPVDVDNCNLVKPLALLPYSFGGKMIAYLNHFEQFSTIDAQKIVTRRAGAPLLQSRGRRRAPART